MNNFFWDTAIWHVEVPQTNTIRLQIASLSCSKDTEILLAKKNSCFIQILNHKCKVWDENLQFLMVAHFQLPPRHQHEHLLVMFQQQFPVPDPTPEIFNPLKVLEKQPSQRSLLHQPEPIPVGGGRLCSLFQLSTVC